MKVQYPATLQFENLDEGQLADLLDAALRLDVPFKANGRAIGISVDTPMQCYQLGREMVVSRQRREKRQAAKKARRVR